MAVDIIYKQGNALNGPEPYLLHGCNAQGRMGSGFAKAAFEKYPEVRSTYIAKHANHPKDKPFLGTVHVVVTSGHTIFNAITQEHFGYDGKLYVSYEAIEQCLTTVDIVMKELWQLKGVPQQVAMPLLGCGLAGGHWPTVASIVERCSEHFQPVVYTLDGVIPGVTPPL